MLDRTIDQGVLIFDDMWDPNTWTVPDHEFRIYGDVNASWWCIVDEEDYHWAVKYCWTKHVSLNSPWKWYLRRAVGVNRNGMRLNTYTLYLHIEIMKRTGILPPSPAHILVDHRDSNSFNCRRSNLRWATPGMNARNRFGRYPHDLIEG